MLTQNERPAINDRRKDYMSEAENVFFQGRPQTCGTLNSRPYGLLGPTQGDPLHYLLGSKQSLHCRIGIPKYCSSSERLRQDYQTLLDCVPEDGSMMFDNEDATYGQIELHDENEEEQRELDHQLRERGLYRGSYLRLMVLYTLAPLTWLIFFASLAMLPCLVYPVDYSIPPSTYPYAPYLPFPLPEFFVSIVLWSFAYALRGPIYALTTTIYSPFSPSFPTLPTFIATGIHTLISIIIRQSAIPLLLIAQSQPLDHLTAWHPAFRRVWWVGLGWSAAEAVVGVKEGYECISLYKDVLVSVHWPLDPSINKGSNGFGSGSERERNSSPNQADISLEAGRSAIDLLDRDAEDDVYGQQNFDDGGEQDSLLRSNSVNERHEVEFENALKLQVDQDIDQLVALKNREELEEIYGMPVIRIPVFISCLQRIDSILLSLGICLLLSSAYLRSGIALTSNITVNSSGGQETKSNTLLIIIFLIVFLLQYFLATLHTPIVLPRMGVHAVVYVGLLVSLGTFFTGLGIWGALS